MVEPRALHVWVVYVLAFFGKGRVAFEVFRADATRDALGVVESPLFVGLAGLIGPRIASTKQQSCFLETSQPMRPCGIPRKHGRLVLVVEASIFHGQLLPTHQCLPLFPLRGIRFRVCHSRS